MDDWRGASLDEPDRSLCELAETLTRDPGGSFGPAVERLRRLGLEDAAISDAVQVVAYFNYINRVAEGLGCDLEPEMPPRQD